MYVCIFTGNYFTGTLPSSIAHTNIDQIVISSNYFTGTLPSTLASMAGLKTMLVQRNFFEGQPDNVFNVTGHLLLTAVDLSFNDFSGTIPERVFTLPILRTFAAVKTCFHGSLPPTICQASSLIVLLMDGVASGLGCQQRINFIGSSSNAYYSTNGAVAGGIPSCIWEMTSLQSLQLSSNSLTGSIANPAKNSNLKGTRNRVRKYVK